MGGLGLESLLRTCRMGGGGGGLMMLGEWCCVEVIGSGVG